MPSNGNGVVTMPTVSAPSSRAILATTGAAPVPVPPPSPAVTKTMSEPRSACLIWSCASSRRAPADLGVGAGAETLRQVAADVDLHLGVRHLQLLQVGVDGDELDLADPGVDHPVDRVQPGAADTDDADDREVRARVGARHAVQARRGLGQRLEPRDRRLVARLGHGGGASGGLGSGSGSTGGA